MPPPKQARSLRDFGGLLPYLQDCGEDAPIIVGGQAVELYGEKYAPTEPELRPLLPCLTEDLDLLGSRVLVRKLGQATGCRTHVTDPFAKTDSPLSGTVYLPSGHAHVLFALRHARLPLRDIRQSAVQVEHEGRVFRVIHPLLLLKEKIHLTICLNQADRNDAAHLNILIPCLRAYLADKVAAAGSDARKGRECVTLLKAVLTIIQSREAETAARRHGYRWERLLPLDALRQSANPKLAAFRDKQLPRFLKAS
jgi:hypothetical protein